jgi:quinol monooxygenase YgiN
VFIAILDLRTDPEDRSAALAQLEAERPEVRAMAGCIDFRPFAPADRPNEVTVLHEWQDEAAFQAYVGSEAFERSSLVIRPLLAEAPVSRRSGPNWSRRWPDRSAGSNVGGRAARS